MGCGASHSNIATDTKPVPPPQGNLQSNEKRGTPPSATAINVDSSIPEVSSSKDECTAFCELPPPEPILIRATGNTVGQSTKRGGRTAGSMFGEEDNDTDFRHAKVARVPTRAVLKPLKSAT